MDASLVRPQTSVPYLKRIEHAEPGPGEAGSRSRQLLQLLDRRWQMLRRVPVRQLGRRLYLRTSYALQPHLPDGRAVSSVAAVPLPLPVFPPRDQLAGASGAGLLLRERWGERQFALPPVWTALDEAPEWRSWESALQSMEFLESLADEAFVMVVSDWIDRNGRRSGRWRPYPLSIRVVEWMQQLAARRQRLDPGFTGKAELSIRRQLRFLESHVETDVHGNHLIRNLRALLWAGAYFTGAEAARWRQRGRRLLEREVAEQILGDGCHHERSPSYHCQVAADLLECRHVLPVGDPLRDGLTRILRRMRHAAQCLTHPDGKVALFNDSGLAMARSLAALDAAGLAELADDRAGEGPWALPDAGYYGLRSRDEYLAIDCGSIGPDALVAHSHGDLLSFEWSTGGRRIVVDQGNYAHQPGAARELCRSSRAHNTVSIGAAEQSDFFSVHRCSRRAHPILLDWRSDGAGVRFAGSHDGFDHLPGRPRHRREIEAQPGWVRIADRIQGGDVDGVAGLLLHPRCVVTGSGRHLGIANGDVRVEITASAPIAVEPAVWFPDMFVWEETVRLRLPVPCRRPDAPLTTVLRRL